MSAEGDAYDALCCYTLGHGNPAFIHQHVVDAYVAQKADERTKPIALTFALVGLYLHVEHGVSGRDVQRAHMALAKPALAKQKQAWPSFALPPERGEITAVEVMSAPAGAARDQAIDAWCASVWNAFRDSGAAVGALLQEHGLEGRYPRRSGVGER